MQGVSHHLLKDYFHMIEKELTDLVCSVIEKSHEQFARMEECAVKELHFREECTKKLNQLFDEIHNEDQLTLKKEDVVDYTLNFDMNDCVDGRIERKAILYGYQYNRCLSTPDAVVFHKLEK